MTTPIAGPLPDLDPAAPLVTDADVLRRVASIVDRPSRRQRSVWLLFLSVDGRQLPVVVPIGDVPARPDPPMIGNLAFVIAGALAGQPPGCSAVVVLTRPGAATPGDTDRYWLATLDGAAREHGAAIRMVCLATPGGVLRLTARDDG